MIDKEALFEYEKEKIINNFISGSGRFQTPFYGKVDIPMKWKLFLSPLPFLT